MRKILKYIKLKDWFIMFFIFILIIVQVNFELLIPGYMSKITLFLQNPSNDEHKLISFGGIMFILAVSSLLISVICAVLNAKIGSNFSFSLRKGIFYKVQELSLEDQSKFTTASLLTRTTNDVVHIERFILIGMQSLVQAPILGMGAIIKIMENDWHWSLTTALAMALIVVVMLVAGAITMSKFKKIQLLTDDINGTARDSLIGIQTVRAYNAEKYHEKKFNLINNELANVNIITNSVMTLLNPTLVFIINILNLAIYFIGMNLIEKEAIEGKAVIFSNMITYSSYTLKLATAFLLLLSMFIFIPQAFVSVRRIGEILNAEPSIKDGTVTLKDNSIIETEIEFRNVDFKYSNGNDNILEGISFKAKKGETIGIVGSTGCGKTTLINLIPRLYDASSGEIIIDGINVKDYDQKILRGKIGYIGQKVILMSGTIVSNVAYSDSGDNVDKDKLNEAIRISNSNEFIEEFEKGINEEILKDGANLSGGQKQRISIARAIYKEPEILIFDDSFSALDYKNDLLVRKALKDKCRDSIKIIVAQRINTIIDADKIIVLENGKIVGIGAHMELISNCEIYQQIVDSQLSKEA